MCPSHSFSEGEKRRGGGETQNTKLIVAPEKKEPTQKNQTIRPAPAITTRSCSGPVVVKQGRQMRGDVEMRLRAVSGDMPWALVFQRRGAESSHLSPQESSRSFLPLHRHPSLSQAIVCRRESVTTEPRIHLLPPMSSMLFLSRRNW